MFSSTRSFYLFREIYLISLLYVLEAYQVLLASFVGCPIHRIQRPLIITCTCSYFTYCDAFKGKVENILASKVCLLGYIRGLCTVPFRWGQMWIRTFSVTSFAAGEIGGVAMWDPFLCQFFYLESGGCGGVLLYDPGEVQLVLLLRCYFGFHPTQLGL